MAKLGILMLTGESGQTYDFDVYSSSVTFNDNIACVYYISKRVAKKDGTGDHTAIYVGETKNIKDRLSTHHKQSCFDQHNYNAVSIHKEKSEDRRTSIETDLIKAISPPCNDWSAPQIGSFLVRDPEFARALPLHRETSRCAALSPIVFSAQQYCSIFYLA